ncbi:uncharacterized protein DUF397 [Actinocorallia herbida]|uniref:Uncharacterized protein DUF397 n=1 Tax=Actinocorallia herbida TaxID=58109 RepID=A0A3N1D959_9ACTN|nr:DUF397 domain-containing protein [Actinocorallia herbida]ROO90031.1 uncharacterized protein DUF397 [Actinocorallia herbida]
MIHRDEVLTVIWRKSSYSAPQGSDCVELGELRGGVGIRDSKSPERAQLNVTRGQLRGLTSRIRSGGI